MRHMVPPVELMALAFRDASSCSYAVAARNDEKMRNPTQ
jgi:hypothetical protein